MDGVLVVTPYYNRPSQAGLYEHFRAVAEAAGDLPVVLYDIPVRSGRRIETPTLLRLAREVPAVVGLKDAAGDPPATAHLVAQAPAGFEVYSGDDVMTLPLLAVGAVGVISVAAHWAGPQFRQALDAFFAGDVAGAVAANAELLDSFDFESSADYPEPAPGQGGAAGARPAGRPVPAAHGRGDARARRHGGEDHRRSRSTGGHATLG